jgi:hypothetical protein
MSESIEPLRSLSRILADNSIKLRKAAEIARTHGAVLRAASQMLREEAAKRREQATAARRRQDADWSLRSRRHTPMFPCRNGWLNPAREIQCVRSQRPPGRCRFIVHASHGSELAYCDVQQFKSEPEHGGGHGTVNRVAVRQAAPYSLRCKSNSAFQRQREKPKPSHPCNPILPRSPHSASQRWRVIPRLG